MIEVKRLVKNYPGKKVLDGLDLKIETGEIFSVMGPSGTGKSTFLKCLIGLNSPDFGEIWVDGRNIAAMNSEKEIQDIRRKMGYLFQEGALFDSLCVWENVAFGLKYLTDIPPEKYLSVAREKLELVGLKNSEYLKIGELSGGMKKRVALARAIAPGPSYLLYDEPTTGLDPVTGEMVARLIKEMSDKIKVTSVVVTHDVKLAMEISNRIAFFYGGKIVEIGSPSQIKSSCNEMVREFLDNSSCAGRGEK
ncbi:MAG: ABC transporter ATP-binding protein [Elusimicrobiota bacterium]